MRSTYTHDGLEFDVTEGGPDAASSEGTVVLLHGFPQRATCWAQVTPTLHAAGLRTLAPDQRGYSPGARPRGRGAYRFASLIGDVAALVEGTGGPVHLVGHDWGAAVAWGLAVSRPELVSSLTAASVPHPSALGEAAVRSTQALHSWYFALFNVPFLVEGVADHAPQLLDGALRRSGMDDEQLARFHREVVDDGALGPALGWYRALPLGLVRRRGSGPAPSGPAPSRPAPSRRVTVPTTYLWSTGDSAITRAAAERCGDHVEADYHYIELDGVSHWIPEEAPDVVAEAVLERVRGTG